MYKTLFLDISKQNRFRPPSIECFLTKCNKVILLTHLVHFFVYFAPYFTFINAFIPRAESASRLCKESIQKFLNLERHGQAEPKTLSRLITTWNPFPVHTYPKFINKKQKLYLRQSFLHICFPLSWCSSKSKRIYIWWAWTCVCKKYCFIIRRLLN